jgi:hypothetical protein
MFKENKNIINKNSLPESESILENNSGLSSNSLEVHSQSIEDAIEALSDINKRLESYLQCNYNK